MTMAAWNQEVLEFSEGALHATFAAFLILWIFALGACLGSFLNVVIHRLPRGLSLIRPKSRCPACGAAIRASDNVPIASWLRLRGRCRDCGEPIAARYPVVEALAAVLLLALAWCELYAGGANLPGSDFGPPAVNPLLWRWDIAQIVRGAYHAYLLMIATALGWIAWDRFPPPRRLVFVSLLVGIVLPAIVPGVWPVPSGIPRWLPEFAIGANTAFTLDLNAFLAGGVGLAAGIFAGVLLALGATSRIDVAGTLALASLAGLFLGWQSVITYAPIAGCLALAGAVASRWISRSIPVTVSCAAALMIQVFVWGQLANWTELVADRIARDGTARALVPAAAMLLTLIFAGTAKLARTTSSAPPAEPENRPGSSPHDSPTLPKREVP